MKSYLNSLKDNFNRLVSFEPTGWTFEKNINLKELKPNYNKNNILQYGKLFLLFSNIFPIKYLIKRCNISIELKSLFQPFRIANTAVTKN